MCSFTNSPSWISQRLYCSDDCSNCWSGNWCFWLYVHSAGWGESLLTWWRIFCREQTFQSVSFYTCFKVILVHPTLFQYNATQWAPIPRWCKTQSSLPLVHYTTLIRQHLSLHIYLYINGHLVYTQLPFKVPTTYLVIFTASYLT